MYSYSYTKKITSKISTLYEPSYALKLFPYVVSEVVLFSLVMYNVFVVATRTIKINAMKTVPLTIFNAT